MINADSVLMLCAWLAGTPLKYKNFLSTEYEYT